VDAGGNLWAGTMAINHVPGSGSLYRISPGLEVKRTLDRIGLPKNAAWSRDNTRLYVSDGGDGVLYQYPFTLESGALGPGQPFVRADPDHGVPNGVCVDAEDHVWVTMHGGWAVHRYAPDGSLVDRVVLPVPMPTNVCFGGKDMRTLFVTTTYLRLPAGYSTIAPLSGTVFAIDAGVAGVPPVTFGR
jgi:sugar lactone lactonase YvrE